MKRALPVPFPLPVAVRALLFQHLAAMEKAGLPAERAYALLDLGPAARARVATFQRLSKRGVDTPTAGSDSGLFTRFETQLLRAAFASGSPQATYERLARSLATAAAQQRALRARLMLPSVILTVALFVQPLPQLFAGTLGGAGYLAKVLLPLIVIVSVGVLVVRSARWFVSGEPGAGREALERLMLDLPYLGQVHVRRNARDFTESLGLLLHAGLPLFDALPVAVATAGNALLREDLSTLLPAVRAGAPLAQAVAALRLIDTVQLVPIIHTGEQSGTLPEMLLRHASAESMALAQIADNLMTWLPRILYSCVALWMAVQILGSAKVEQASDIVLRAVPQWRG